MEKQMALFKVNSNKHNEHPTQLFSTDKIYLAFPKGLAQRLNIFQGGKACQSIALDYVNNGDILGEKIGTICKRSNQTKPHHYYHYIDHKFLPYNSWLLKMILKTETQSKSNNKSIKNNK